MDESTIDLWEIVLTCVRMHHHDRVIYKKHEYVQRRPTTRELADLLCTYADHDVDVLKMEIFSRTAMLSEPTDIAEK